MHTRPFQDHFATTIMSVLLALMVSISSARAYPVDDSLTVITSEDDTLSAHRYDNRRTFRTLRVWYGDKDRTLAYADIAKIMHRSTDITPDILGFYYGGNGYSSGETAEPKGPYSHLPPARRPKSPEEKKPVPAESDWGGEWKSPVPGEMSVFFVADIRIGSQLGGNKDKSAGGFSGSLYIPVTGISALGVSYSYGSFGNSSFNFKAVTLDFAGQRTPAAGSGYGTLKYFGIGIGKAWYGPARFVSMDYGHFSKSLEVESTGFVLKGFLGFVPMISPTVGFSFNMSARLFTTPSGMGRPSPLVFLSGGVGLVVRL